ncbi:MAG TPA: metallophosphoesterase family protein [Candidatus Ozemobacteraceae bacterium]|nr:metallophosphoesterase family protein [Candidatus Ozemobacteraceae bacterium]
MKIGLISDTHTHSLDAWILDAFSGVDLILHAGDMISDHVLLELQAIAPTLGVRGNCDPFFPGLPPIRRLKTKNGEIVMAHRPEHVMGLVTPETFLVVHGHTHEPRFEPEAHFWVANPGSPSSPRGGNRPSVLIVEVAAQGNAPICKGEFKFPPSVADG